MEKWFLEERAGWLVWFIEARCFLGVEGVLDALDSGSLLPLLYSARFSLLVMIVFLCFFCVFGSGFLFQGGV